MKFNVKEYVLAGVVALLLTACHAKHTDDTLTWDCINVNAHTQQGDAHLFSKDGKHVLVDAGHISYSKRFLLPLLQKREVKQIDDVLISHPHNDHYSGVKALFENNISIRTLHMNMPTKEQMDREYWGGTFSELLEIKQLALKHGTKVIPIRQGDKITFDKNCFMKVLYVYNGIDTPVGKTDINDMSAIMMVYHGKNRFLLTGDLNKKLGKYLAENANDIEADILKFPHHGTESFAPNSFFEKVHPKVLIVPSPKFLWSSKRSKRARMLAKEKGYKTYVSGYNGLITVISDGAGYAITTEVSVNDILNKGNK